MLFELRLERGYKIDIRIFCIGWVISLFQVEEWLFVQKRKG